MSERNYEIDMEKLEQAFFRNLINIPIEYGSIGLDFKRPFGNSDVEEDILEIIGANPEGEGDDLEIYSDEQIEYAANLYKNLINWLQSKYIH